MNTQSSDEWFQDYQQNIGSRSLPELSFDETLDLVTNITPSLSGDATSTSPKLSGLSSNGPKSGIGKPIRRRSRASKKAPTTLLNANTNNFRALVQQFTGCHSAPPAFGPYKGPINLNFARYKYPGDEKSTDHQFQRQQQSIQNRRERTDQSFSSFGTNAVAAAVKGDEDLFVSTVNDIHNPRDDDALTLDDFDMESFSLQELSGVGDYSDALHGNRNDEFWG